MIIDKNFLVNPKGVFLTKGLKMRCYLCESENVRVIYDFKNMHIYKCASCHLMFQDYSSKADLELDNLSENIYKKVYFGVSKKDNFNIAQEILNRIRNYCHFGFKDLSILEIGVGSGMLASQLMENGADYRGIELSQFFYDKISESFPEIKKRICNSSLADANMPKHNFDLIIMIDTLEHIPYPHIFLKQLRPYLKENGKLYIEVPNESFFGIRGYLRKILRIYLGLPTFPDHVNLFTKRTMGKVLRSAGFTSFRLKQFTILGDYSKIRRMLNHKMNIWAWVISVFFRFTKLDLILQQGNIAVVVYANKEC